MKTFSLPYKNDKRMIYAKEYLEANGFECIESSSDSDFVLLPIPVKKCMLDSVDNSTVFYGAGEYDKGYDYNKNESFLLSNAALTCEGAIALLKETSDISILDSQILITGYGRIAKALHKALSALGARVTVCARKKSQRTEAQINGAKAVDFDALKKNNNYDFVFNTVAHPVFNKKELEALKDEVIIFDLASFPGGVDTLIANSKGINLVNGRGLPARYSKKSAGILIGKAVIDIIEEECI